LLFNPLYLHASVGAGDGGKPQKGAVKVCGSPNPLEVAEWLPSNV
jgi:hypothetical protein